MDIRPIENESDYRAALAEIERLIDEDEDPVSADRLKVLAILAEAWQRDRRPIGAAKPVDALRAALEDRGVSRRQLAKLLGGESKVSEVLSGKRGLSLTMVAALHRKLQIPLRSLIDLDARPKPRGAKRARRSCAARSRTKRPGSKRRT